MSWQRLAPVLAVAIVVAAIVAGLMISGSPERQRLLRLDVQRIIGLSTLSSALSRQYMETRALPARLDALVDGRTLAALPRDPASGADYAYEILEQRVFQLCAEFALPSDGREPDDFWEHAAGHQCFRFDFSTLRIQ